MPVSVDIPAPRGTPPAHGLLATAQTPDIPVDEDGNPSVRWEQGFTFTTETCDAPESWIIPCNGPAAPVGAGATITENRGTDGPVTWYPFQARSNFKCDAQQFQSIDFRARAQRIYELGQSKLLESELWRGDASGAAGGATNFSLAGGAANSPSFVDVSTGITDAAPGIGLRALIQAAAQSPSGNKAMLHATPDVATGWVQSGGVYRANGGRLKTVVGDHDVVVGTGYDGTGPGVVAPASPIQWAYVTSPVYYLKTGDIQVLGEEPSSGMNRDANDWTVIVQETCIAYFDGCLHAGAPIDAMGTAI